jgi:hypothetical protein
MMPTEDFLQLFVRMEEPWQEWPVLLADDDLGPKFHALLEDEELEAVFREFKVSRGLPE